MRRLHTITVGAGLALVLAACGASDEPATTSADNTSGDATTIRLLTHDSFFVSEDVFADFAAETGIVVELLQAGDAGTVTNQAILTKANPIADVLFGIDNTFLSRALAEDLFVPYDSPNLATVPESLQLDDAHRVTPIDFGDVCINFDRTSLDAARTPPPASLLDLADPQYAGMLVVQDPATSSPGLAFLLATIAEFGEAGDYTWEDYWSDLAANDVLVTSGWEEAYYGAFSGGGGEGDRPIVVSYASSPPAEVFFADPPPDEAPTASMTEGCFRQIEFAGILQGTALEPEAKQLVDFMLSLRFQEDVPLSMFVFPAREDATLPEVFVANSQIPAATATLDPNTIADNREAWIQTWSDLQR